MIIFSDAIGIMKMETKRKKKIKEAKGRKYKREKGRKQRTLWAVKRLFPGHGE